MIVNRINIHNCIAAFGHSPNPLVGLNVMCLSVLVCTSRATRGSLLQTLLGETNDLENIFQLGRANMLSHSLKNVLQTSKFDANITQ